MADGDPLRLQDLRRTEDIERLHPHDYTDLKGTTASRLDLMRVQLGVVEQLDQLNAAFQQFQQEVIRAMEQAKE